MILCGSNAPHFAGKVLGSGSKIYVPLGFGARDVENSGIFCLVKTPSILVKPKHYEIPRCL
jgi:hypothetical protein